MSISNRTRGTLMVVVGAIIMSFEGLLIRQVSVDRWTMICWRGFFVFSTLSIGMIVCWRRRFLSRFFAIGWTGVDRGGHYGHRQYLFRNRVHPHLDLQYTGYHQRRSIDSSII